MSKCIIGDNSGGQQAVVPNLQLYFTHVDDLFILKPNPQIYNTCTLFRSDCWRKVAFKLQKLSINMEARMNDVKARLQRWDASTCPHNSHQYILDLDKVMF